MQYALWTIQILLAMLFLFAGSMKLIQPNGDSTYVTLAIRDSGP